MEASIKQAIIDTSSLIAAGRRPWPSGVSLLAPLTVVEELLCALQVSDKKAAGQKKSALRTISEGPVELGAGFHQCVSAAFGEARPLTVREKNDWLGTIRIALKDQEQQKTLERWRAIPARGGLGWAPEVILWMKDNKALFKSSYRAMIDSTTSIDENAFRNRDATHRTLFPSTMPQFRTGRLFNTAEMLLLLQLAAMAKIGEFDRALDAMELQESDDAVVSIAAPAMLHVVQRYRSGLDMAIRLTAAAQASYLTGQGAPDENDFFDFCILSCVDDDESTVFVVEERRWHEAAKKEGLSHRVLNFEGLCRKFESRGAWLCS